MHLAIIFVYCLLYLITNAIEYSGVNIRVISLFGSFVVMFCDKDNMIDSNFIN